MVNRDVVSKVPKFKEKKGQTEKKTIKMNLRQVIKHLCEVSSQRLQFMHKISMPQLGSTNCLDPNPRKYNE